MFVEIRQLLPAGCAAVVFSATAAVTFDAPGHVCVEGAAPAARGGKAGSAWTLLDWRGAPTGFGGKFDARGETALPRLPAGYYRLAGEPAITASGPREPDVLATIAVVSAPEDLARPASQFYGVDSAQSWVSSPGSFACPWNGGDTFRTVSDLVRLAGFPHVRERMRWGEVEKAPGAFDYGKYMYNADLLRERGVAVLGMFHDCPPWAGPIRRLPSRLDVVYDSCKRLAADFGDRMRAWEFWNEPDISFAPEPVWDYAAALKAAYLGMKAARPDMPVMHGGFSQPPAEAYSEALYDNDAGKFSDAYTIHNYGSITDYSAFFAAVRDFLRRHGFGGRAVFVTESGTNLEGPAAPQETPPPGAGAECGARKGVKAHSPEQELVVAEFYPKSQIAMQMEGVSRNFFFVFGAYGERGGAKDWGTLRRDGTAKPVFAAMSTMLREVGSARLEGEIRVGDGLRAYLFGHADGSQTVAFWAVSPVDTARGGTVSAGPDCGRTLRLELPRGTWECVAGGGRFRFADMCGAVSFVESAADGALPLPVTRFPAYVSGLSALKADVPARPMPHVSPYLPDPGEDLTVVLRAELDPEDFEMAGNKTCAMFKGVTGRARIQVWNLGDGSKTGRVDVAGCHAEGLPDTIALGPRGSPPFEFDCTLVPAGDADAVGALDFAGSFDGRRSSRLHVPFAVPHLMFKGARRKELGWRSVSNWRRNDSADVYDVVWDEAEQAIRFDVAWSDPDIDRWFYPVLRLRSSDESLDDAAAVVFEVKTAQDKIENDFRHSMVWLDGKRGGQTRLRYRPPVETWERRLVPLNGLAMPEDVAALRIGANPQGSRMTFWIRNVEILQ